VTRALFSRKRRRFKMAKFYGEVGYAATVKTAPGVFKEKITERPHSGDVIRISRNLQAGENLNDDLNINNQFSIIADPFAYENFHSMRYVKWMGGYWKISKIDVQRPRLILTVGGVYNGEKAPITSAP
jgi:hypothetical protein